MKKQQPQVKRQLTVQVDVKTFEQVERRAKAQERTVAWWLRSLIRAALAKEA